MEPSAEKAESPYAPLDLYLSLSEADLMSGILQASGLEPQVRDAYTAGLSWYYIPAMGGVRLEVPAEQWEDAHKLLSEGIEPIEQTEQELADLEEARRQRRALGAVALALQLLPIAAPVIMGFFLASALFRKDESPD